MILTTTKQQKSIGVEWGDARKNGVRIVIEFLYDLNGKQDLIKDDFSDTTVPVVKNHETYAWSYLDRGITALHRLTRPCTSNSLLLGHALERGGLDGTNITRKIGRWRYED